MNDTELLSEIHNTLHKVHTEITEVKTTQKLQATITNSRLKKIEGHLEGNGKPGFNIRIDRLERISQWSGKFLWVLIPIFLGLVFFSVKYSFS